jgi:hypothetical protein
MIGTTLWRNVMSAYSVRATPDEKMRHLPGDDLIGEPLQSLTHAITVRCSPAQVWPWLAQMGAGRAGWYSYDAIDNGGKHSADRIIPELQTIEVGYLFPWLPGATEGFTLLACEPGRSLVLGAPAFDGSALVTWAFVVEPRTDGTTRLIVRARGSRAYRFQGLPEWVTRRVVPAGHFVMERRQLLGIARRAELAGGVRRRLDLRAAN